MHIHTAYACNVRPQCCVYSQETGRHASTLTLKWRHRGSGWGRSSSSCPMPTPLLNPQLDNPSQVSLLGTTLTNLLKKNISEPFQLTLLNVGVTNFVGAKGVSAGGWFISATRSLFFTLKSCASSPIVCPSFPFHLLLLLLHFPGSHLPRYFCARSHGTPALFGSPLLHPFFFPPAYCPTTLIPYILLSALPERHCWLGPATCTIIHAFASPCRLTCLLLALVMPLAITIHQVK